MVVRQLFKHTKEDLQSYKIKSGQLKQSYLDYISEFHLSETTRGKTFIGFCFSRERLQNLHPSLFFFFRKLINLADLCGGAGSCLYRLLFLPTPPWDICISLNQRQVTEGPEAISNVTLPFSPQVGFL